MRLPTDTLDRSKKYYVTFTINDHHNTNSTAKARRANGGRGGNALELGVEGKAAAKGSRRVNGRCDLLGAVHK